MNVRRGGAPKSRPGSQDGTTTTQDGPDFPPSGSFRGSIILRKRNRQSLNVSISPNSGISKRTKRTFETSRHE